MYKSITIPSMAVTFAYLSSTRRMMTGTLARVSGKNQEISTNSDCYQVAKIP
jgi:hypothetical protein